MTAKENNSYLIILAGGIAVGKTLLMSIIQKKLSDKQNPLNKYFGVNKKNILETFPENIDLKYFSFSGIYSSNVNNSLFFGVTRVVSISDIETIRSLKERYLDKVIIIYLDGEDADKSFRLVHTQGYAEHGFYIPEGFFKSHKDLYEDNRGLFDFTVVNNSTPEWLYEQVETFILSKLNSKDYTWENEELSVPEIKEIITLDLIIANDRINKYFANHPNEIFKLTSREFENLIAGILYDLKYDVELTKETRDGGFDIKAIKKDGIGPLLYLVECKKYAKEKPVGVEIVRGLHSVKTSLQASKAIIVTTSYFTEDAKELQRNLGYQIDLKGFNDIVNWLTPYK